ncbi:biopolymer transport protein ExbD [Polystyrenella longa]|uniref:Biopolymer transport protein ExbD n=1 Tax=Polystyrenella longa TaxID=2528007 RepID=A0A518CRG9_9PLAN|nr:biopolymer transporter ExbD [Polystyrenella longa]QDU81822.1 biopolymer transport protein ExbD [Polystyrenella longa]
MRIPVRPREGGFEFNVTPLIDIVFLLVIFFLVTSQLVQHDTSREVSLPEAVLAQKEERAHPNRLIITVSVDEDYSLGGRIVPRAEILQVISRTEPETAVRFRTDKDVPFRLIEPLMHACAEQGLTDVSFAVDQK